MARKHIRSSEDIFRMIEEEGPFFFGLIKKAEEKTHIKFSIDTTCANWIPIPVRMILDCISYGEHQCGDDMLPLVRLKLEIPSNEAAMVFAQLAAAPRATSSEERGGFKSIVPANLVASLETLKPMTPGWCRDVSGEWYSCPPYRD